MFKFVCSGSASATNSYRKTVPETAHGYTRVSSAGSIPCHAGWCLPIQKIMYNVHVTMYNNVKYVNYCMFSCRYL